ncbi:MAG: O-phospho-L-seryl-tRNA:Cys-tRNA synthase [Candidatus Lokiarchaeota archaeon]|nr:O-phospho-L-seryl-tRNA:Cys-tRNA synthase [Candidatus Lokiarchaeota archaeon]MBD3339887.1 O-phospho-L-seryl-tRNA:Cys-tRNA synthase [Candidatus Lokiarchaeota archaeon]
MLPDLEYNSELVQKYAHLTRKTNEEFINIHPIQRGGLLTREAYKALIDFGDGYSLCDNCLKGRIDKIENPPVVDFLQDLAMFLNIDNVMPTAAARESKRLVMKVLSDKFPKRKTVIVDSLAHYTTYLAIESNNLRVREVPNSGHPEFKILSEEYDTVIKKIEKKQGEKPLLAVLTHVDYKYGNFNDPKPVGAICRDHDVPFLLNAAYSAGVLPINCKEKLIDFIACSGHKSMAASGPIGVLGFSEQYYDDIMAHSSIQGNLTSKSFPNKICTVMGCPPVYGAPLITLMASFPEIVRRTQPKKVKEEVKKANYVINEIKKIEGIEVLGTLPKVHPLTNILTEPFDKVAKTHSRRGFFVRDEFKERGIIGMAPGISKEMKFNTFGLTWSQIKYFAKVFLEIAQKYNLI